MDRRTTAARPGAALRAALAAPRFEIIPLEGAVESVAAHVPRSTVITVTASPRRGLDATVAATERLRRLGYDVVPHLAARLVGSERELKEIVDRLDAVAVRDAFVVGGDSAEPAGPFADALALLTALDAWGHCFEDIGITGYPESHPTIDDDLLVQAMWDKRRYATYVVSQVCFTPAPILAWLGRLRRRGVELPVRVGIPGVAQRRRLLRIARRIGVGESGRFVRRHREWAWRLALPGAYRPQRLLAGIAPALAEESLGVVGLHVFTFNELQRTEEWRAETVARLDRPPDRRAS